MTDISAFAEEDFDPKAWVNTLTSQRQQSNGSSAEEPVDKFLAEMEMRLQLAAEEIEAGLHESSAQALRRLPFAVQEIYRLQVRTAPCSDAGLRCSTAFHYIYTTRWCQCDG